MRQCPAKSSFWEVFKFSNFFDFRELQRASIKWSLCILNRTIIIKLLGTDFIISHTFQCEHYFSFACPGKVESITRVILLDTVPYVSTWAMVV